MGATPKLRQTLSVGPICIASEWNEGLPSAGRPLDPPAEALESYRVPWVRGSHQWDVSTPMADCQSPLDQGLGGQGNVKLTIIIPVSCYVLML